MCFSLAWATKYAIGPKMSLGSSGTDFDHILAAFGMPGGASNGAKSVPGGSRKKHRFSRPLFFWFWLIFDALGSPKLRLRLTLFRFFSAPGGYVF